MLEAQFITSSEERAKQLYKHILDLCDVLRRTDSNEARIAVGQSFKEYAQMRQRGIHKPSLAEWDKVREAAIRGRARIDILQAAKDFYALEAMAALLCDKNENDFDAFRPSHTRWYRDFVAYRNEYVENLANAIFDYTAIVVAGEMRHAQNCASSYIEEFGYDSDYSRSDVYGQCTRWTPESILEAGVKIFDPANVTWKSSFGGKKWGQIARAGLRKRNFNSPSVFIDHCVDLSHNNSVYFDKGANIFYLHSGEHYKKFLDMKRKATTAEVLQENLSDNIRTLLRRACILGVYRLDIITLSQSWSTSKQDFCNDEWVLNYIPAEWGTKVLSSRLCRTSWKRGSDRRRADEDEREDRDDDDDGAYELKSEIRAKKGQVSSAQASAYQCFKVGDRVIGVGSYCGKNINGFSGKVAKANESGSLAIHFDKNIGGHNCGGSAPFGHGWNVSPRHLKLARLAQSTKPQPRPLEFKIGDRVIGVGKYEGKTLEGLTGKIVATLAGKRYGVYWNDWCHGHDLQGKCSYGHGWWVLAANIKLANPAPVATGCKIEKIELKRGMVIDNEQKQKKILLLQK